MAMQEKEPMIFLSYTRKDSAIVKELYRKLQKAGYNPWMDIEDILPGEEWEKKIERAIAQSSIFLACLSTKSVNHRGVVQQEIREALQVSRRKLDDDIYIIPVRLNKCKVPSSLSKHNYVDLFSENSFSLLLSAIRSQMARFGYFQKVKLRASPATISENQLKRMLKKRGFYENNYNCTGKGIHHQYEIDKRHKTVIDHTSGLIW